jgi:hypothetical protein
MLHLDEVDVYKNRPADSVLLNKNGRFSFSFETRVPCFYQLSYPVTRYCFIPNGEHIRLKLMPAT